MKIYLKLTLLFLAPLFSFAQNLSDAKPYRKALELAAKNNKPLLVIIDAQAPNPGQAKKPTSSLALKEKSVVKKMKANFVVYETNRADTTIFSIIYGHKINRYPAFIFLHANKNPFYSDFGYSSDREKYLTMFDKAILISKEKSISTLEEEYLAHKTDNGLLKKLIELKKKFGLMNNANLIEEYASNLRPSDFENYETILFVLEAGPDIEGNAYKLSWSNPTLFKSIYKKESVEKRHEINNAIINNTFTAAVKEKNEKKVTAIANFIRGTWANDYFNGNKAAEARMLSFYYAIKDTATYLKTAIGYYDRYYMSVSIDSIKKMEAKSQLEEAELMKKSFSKTTGNISQAKMDSLIKTGRKVVTTVNETVGTPVYFPSYVYAGELNSIAYRFYQTGTKNINYLTKAMVWSKRSIEVRPMWSYYDTLAHLYYAMGRYDEAITNQKIAVTMVKKEKQADAILRMEKEYEKMKNRTL